MRHRNLIGPQVQKLRNQRGWSQEQLAAKLQIAGWDVSRNGLAMIETCIQWIRAICACFSAVERSILVPLEGN